MELGGMLSHGAVVAREYKLPGIAGMRGATRILNNGERVILDGRLGRVWRIDAEL